MNLNRERCVDCGLELKDVEAMSTEQNTQRPKFYGHPTRDYCMNCGDWKEGHGEFCKPVKPPPETGAVDVEKLAYDLSVIEWGDPACHGQMLPVPQKMKFIASIIAPLTQRIAQLEQENERLKREAHQSRCNAESSDNWRQEAARQEQRAESANYMGNLLAIVHRDGGHYRSEHGTKKATDDAIAIVSELKHRLGRLEHTTYGIPAFPQSITESAKRHQQQPEQMEALIQRVKELGQECSRIQSEYNEFKRAALTLTSMASIENAMKEKP